MKTLIVVDVQYDFIPVSEEDYKNNLGGALAVPDGDKIIPIINKLLSEFELVIFTKDWHPIEMTAFASSHEGKKPYDRYVNHKNEVDVLWPDHCIQNTRGADIHDDIDFDKIKGSFYIFKKGRDKNKHPYSGFEGTNLTEFLKKKNVTDVYICGLARDFCCKETAIDAVNNGFNTIFIIDATREISLDGSKKTIKELTEHNIKIIESWELPLFKLTY